MKTYDFLVPAHNIRLLDNKLVKVNKRADKLGMPRVEYVRHASKFVTEKHPVTNLEIVHEYVPVTIAGEMPVIDGWTVVGAIDHDAGFNAIRSIEEMPKMYRDAKPHCDHCNTNRIKKTSVIIRHGDEYKQVGKSCLLDFINRDTQSELAYIEWFTSIIGELQDDESAMYGGSSEPLYSVDSLLKIIACAVRQWGYTSIAKSEERGTNSTKADVFMYLYGTAVERSSFAFEDGDDEMAAVVKEWIINEENDSDFFYTLKGLIEQPAIDSKYAGYLAGGFAFYLNTQRKAAEKAATTNEYIGEIKKRQDFKDLTVKYINITEGYYGSTYIYTFHDVDGRTLVWFASSESDMEVGGTYTVKATVKAHKEYRDTKQTIITRAKVQ